MMVKYSSNYFSSCTELSSSPSRFFPMASIFITDQYLHVIFEVDCFCVLCCLVCQHIKYEFFKQAKLIFIVLKSDMCCIKHKTKNTCHAFQFCFTISNSKNQTKTMHENMGNVHSQAHENCTFSSTNTQDNAVNMQSC